jgi:hypothetical protein
MAYFVWTRMQDEAGQTLHTIIRRKEAERASGNGEPPLVGAERIERIKQTT